MTTATILNEPPNFELKVCPGHVLVVDDEEHNRTLLHDPLEALGYDIIEAVNGEEALERARTSLPDVILLDVMMPGMDGFEVCRQLKASSLTAFIPVLMVTALSDRQERLMGIKAGANDFLNKPVDLQDVILRVKNAVYTKKLFEQLQAEKKRADGLLLNVFPSRIAQRIKSGETNIADFCPEATVLFTDLVGFTTLSATVGPTEIVNLLNEIFTSFDHLTEELGLEKIKTIGDAYMAAGGVPVAQPNHAKAVLELAVGMRNTLDKFNSEYKTSLRVRTGIASGPLIAGVIGRRKFAYDIWGDTVNLASYLANAANPGCILVSESTAQFMKKGTNPGSFSLQPLAPLTMKGLGEVRSYSLL